MSYPYYIVPDVEKYKTLDPASAEAKKLARKIAANIGDLASLRLILGIDPPEFARFYPDMETSTPSTMDTIDAFLDKFGGNISTIGYEPEETPELGELIKAKRFKEAIELIERQNLNIPEKSVYFAHQIRFLKKLVAIQNYRNKTEG